MPTTSPPASAHLRQRPDQMISPQPQTSTVANKNRRPVVLHSISTPPPPPPFIHFPASTRSKNSPHPRGCTPALGTPSPAFQQQYFVYNDTEINNSEQQRRIGCHRVGRNNLLPSTFSLQHGAATTPPPPPPRLHACFGNTQANIPTTNCHFLLPQPQ